METNVVKMPSFWAAVSKLTLGIICYSLHLYYFPPVCDLSSGAPEITRTCIVHLHIPIVACVGFTFVIELAIIATYLTNAECYEKTIMNCAFSLAGTIVYITGGCMMIHTIQTLLPGFDIPPPYLATGTMFIITGLVYLVHFVYALGQRNSMGYFRINNDLGQALSPN